MKKDIFKLFNKKTKNKKKMSSSLNFYKKESTKLAMIEVVFLSIVACVVGVLTGFLLGNNTSKIKYQEPKNSNSLNRFISSYQYILNNYYGDEEITEDEILESALNGVLESLKDSNTVYMDENTSNNFNIQLEGTYQGLGVEIANLSNSNNIIIVSIFKDSPADKAGLLPGDIILKIDDQDIEAQTSAYFVKYIRNSDKKDFKLLISRENKQMEINVKKEQITLKSVASKIYQRNNKKIGYIYMSIFANNTYSQFKQNLEELESQGIDSLIIDVRDNTGGHMSSVKDILSLFLDQQNIIFQTQNKKGIEKVYSEGKINKTYKIVLLTNRNSASSSEILVSALSDNLNSIIVGEKTYGKGTVQELQTLPSGAQYKFTTKKWLTPKGICIDKEGITPNYEVQLSEEYIKNPSEENDNQLQKALEILQ